MRWPKPSQLPRLPGQRERSLVSRMELGPWAVAIKNVDTPTFRSFAILAGLSPAASNLRAVSIFSGVIASFRPPQLPPFARTAAKPAMVRSLTSSRSLSATEARI
jgi:hypothetical protein